MFTGIVQEIGRVVSMRSGRLVIAARQTLQGLEAGGSIAVNGACLTVTNFDTTSFSMEVMPETLRRTNLGLLKGGDGVNLERPLTLSGEMGGHLVQGHVDGVGKVLSVTREGEAMLLRFEAAPEVMRYLVEKGFIALDGVSLTVVTKDSSSFSVSIVDYTRQHTTLGSRKVGDLVDLEVDIIAKYVEQLTQVHRGITADFLKEHGFLTS